MFNSTVFKSRSAFFFLGFFCFGVAISGDIPAVISFEEGEQFNVSLSNINFNRVFVEGETIIKLSYPEHALTVDKSEISNLKSTEGSVYIKPNFETPITLFLTTDKGHHVSLTLSPVESFGKTFRLIARTQTQLKYVKPSAQSLSEVDEAMAAMKAGESPKDFNVKRVLPSPFYIKKDIKVTLEKEYQGTRLTGYVYRLENKSKHEITLTTDLFSHKFAQSLSLSEEQLLPKKVAYLYGLYTNQG